MQSSDRELLLDIHAEQLRQRKEFQEFKAVVLDRLNGLDTQIEILKNDQSALQTSVYWGFALMGIVIALFTLWQSTPKGRQQGDIPPAAHKTGKNNQFKKL